VKESIHPFAYRERRRAVGESESENYRKSKRQFIVGGEIASLLIEHFKVSPYRPSESSIKLKGLEVVT
jgi:hypothetical protein